MLPWLQRYKDLRNAVVDRYREDPTRRLGFSEAAASMPDQGPGLLRIWSFLDEWGIINFQARVGVVRGQHSKEQGQGLCCGSGAGLAGFLRKGKVPLVIGLG